MTAANNPNFNPEKYTTIASNHLVIYSIHSLYKDGDEISAEDIISACFMLFPKKFSLRTYPQWPDSALVGRRLHDCEKSGWLTARIDTGFKLTAMGKKLAEKVAKELGLPVHKKEKPKRVGEAQVNRLQVDKLQVIEVAVPVPVAKPAPVEPKEKVQERIDKEKPVGKLQVVEPAPITLKPEEKAKAPAIETPKPVEKKAAAPVEKPALVKPKPAKKTRKQKRVGKLQVSKTVKPAPAKPKVEKVKEKRVADIKVAKAVKLAPVKQKPTKKVKKKQAGKLQVPKTVKPAEKAKAPVVKAPKPAEKKVAAPVVKPAPAKLKPAKKVKKKQVARKKPVGKLRVDKLKVTEAKPAPKVKTAVHRPPSIVQVQKRITETVKVVETPKAKVFPPSTVLRQLSLLPTVSAEEKARAGKFVKMMETSDAYRLYKKNGANASIGEFDFRSLLLCTMESSHETLARNVELFKGYAGIHNRQDLITFLTFCREKFAHLLLPEKKAVRKYK